jgi:hypothetical protein
MSDTYQGLSHSRWNCKYHLVGLDHRIGHLWPLSMALESSNAFASGTEGLWLYRGFRPLPHKALGRKPLIGGGEILLGVPVVLEQKTTILWKCLYLLASWKDSSDLGRAYETNRRGEEENPI